MSDFDGEDEFDMNDHMINDDTIVSEGNDFDSEEIIEEKENLFYYFLDNISSSKKFKGFAIALAALLFICDMYVYYGIFSFEPRDLSDYNIYCENQLVISEEEKYRIISELEQELDISIAEDDYESYCLLNAVLKNENLTAKEKKVFYCADKLIKDNPYINKETAYKALFNVDISHKCRPIRMNNNIEGLFVPEADRIGIFVLDPEKRVEKHEAVHCIFYNENRKNLPRYFNEGMTELLANEYFSDEHFLEEKNYPFEIAMVKMLCEVSTPDAVLQAYSTGNMSFVAEEITKVTDCHEETMNALNAFNKLIEQFKGSVKAEEIIDNQTLIDECIPVFRGVLTAKYKNDKQQKEAYYYNEALFANIFEENSYDKYMDTVDELGCFYKAYFSSELKAELAENKSVQKVKSNEGYCNN